MIKEAIAYITNLAVQAEKPEVLEINGRTYCTKNMTRYDKADMADPIKATTLTSLVDYIKQRRDELREHMIIQVVSATEVRMYSGLLDERDREELFVVNALLPRFEFGQQYDQESFIVSLQSCFQNNGDREAVAMLASSRNTLTTASHSRQSSRLASQQSRPHSCRTRCTSYRTAHSWRLSSLPVTSCSASVKDAEASQFSSWWQQMAVSGKLRRSTTSRNTWRMLSTVLRTANRSQSSHNMIPA